MEKPNIMDSLKQKNKKSLNGIEMSLGETKIITIPTQVREEELNLLRTAVNFQPELYSQIEELSTKREQEDMLNLLLNLVRKELLKFHMETQEQIEQLSEYHQDQAGRTEANLLTKMEQTEKNIRTIQSEMQASIKQAGKNQESYLKNTLQKGSELEKRLAEQAKKAGAFTAVKWILISVLSSTVSTLLLHLFLK